MKTPTKSLIQSHNYSANGSGVAPVSASTDFGSFSEKKEDGMRVCRGPFNVNCTTSREPQQVMYEMVRSLELSKVSYKKVSLKTPLNFTLGGKLWSTLLKEQRPLWHGNRTPRQFGQHLPSQIQETRRRDLLFQGSVEQSPKQHAPLDHQCLLRLPAY